MVLSAHTTIAQLSSETVFKWLCGFLVSHVCLLLRAWAVFCSFSGPAMRHSGVLGSSQITGTDQDEINCFLLFMGGWEGVSANVPYCVCRKGEFPLTKKLRLTPSHVKAREDNVTTEDISAGDCAVIRAAQAAAKHPKRSRDTMSFLLAFMCGTCHSRTFKRGRSSDCAENPRAWCAQQSCHDSPTSGKWTTTNPFFSHAGQIVAEVNAGRRQDSDGVSRGCCCDCGELHLNKPNSSSKCIASGLPACIN